VTDGASHPGTILMAWLTIVGTVVALVLLARSSEPLAVKLLAVGCAGQGVCLIAVFYLGRWRERAILMRRIHTLERRLQRIEGGDPAFVGDEAA